MSARRRQSELASAKGKKAAAPTPAPRRKTFLYAAVGLLALVGLGDAIYLTVEHLAGRSVQCTITSGCEQVLTSPYATIKGVPLAGVGALAYFTVFSLATLAAFGNRGAETFLFYVAMLMLAVSAWLFYLQAFVLHAFCQFCLLSAVIVLLLAILVSAERFYFKRRQTQS